LTETKEQDRDIEIAEIFFLTGYFN